MKVIPLSDLRADPEGVLRRCYDSGQSLVVELPDHGLISIRPGTRNRDAARDPKRDPKQGRS